MICVKFFFIFALFNQAIASAIPIWERLTHHEKISSLTFTFFQLVHLYCKHSDIPDCEKVLTLYGVSNLLKEDEDSLDLLDPYQRNARDLLWKTVMSGGFSLPNLEKERRTHPSAERERETDLNTISHYVDRGLTEQFDYEDEISERYPYAVRVPPPPHFRRTQSESDLTRNENRGKSLQNPPTGHSTTQKRPIQTPKSHSQSTPVPTTKTRLQNSPIISITPYNRSSSKVSSLPSTEKAPSDNSTRGRPKTSRNEREKSDTLYILPSNQRQKPILLRILQS